MKEFLKKTGLFLCLPALLLLMAIAGYFIFDPLKVIYHYNRFYTDETSINRDYVTTETFIQNYRTEGYNSFVFGSSRAIGYNDDTWKQYLDKDAILFSFDSSAENISGIYRKIMLLDSLNVPIKNVLLLIDTEPSFFITSNKGFHLTIKHPLLLGNSLKEWINFHEIHLSAYMNVKFLSSYYPHKLFGIDKNFTRKHRSRGVEVQYPSNWLKAPYLDKYIAKNPYYYQSSEFYERSSVGMSHRQPLITSKAREMLSGIKRIFVKHHTYYKVVVNPLYDQINLHENDKVILESIFGEENVYDFSGKNDFTKSKYNYYESSHFRPSVGDSIMRIIYDGDKDR